MFKASLENNNNPEMGTVTVEFPIPEDQYEETIRALKKIKIGTTLDKVLSRKLNDALSSRLFYAHFDSHRDISHFKSSCFCELFF